MDMMCLTTLILLFCRMGECCVCNKVLGGSMEQTHQFEYIELHVEINLSIPARIGV
jgi:hypothetical protein